MSSTILHVRAETKPLEHRTAITPTIAKKLVDAGYTVNVEKSPLSIFKDEEYEGTGASLVPTGSWTDVPSDHIIIGLKELPEEDFPLKHTVCLDNNLLNDQLTDACNSTSNSHTVRQHESFSRSMDLIITLMLTNNRLQGPGWLGHRPWSFPQRQRHSPRSRVPGGWYGYFMA